MSHQNLSRIKHKSLIQGKIHIKFEQRPQVFAQFSFRELCKLSGLHPSDYIAISWDKKGQKQKGSLWVYESSIPEAIFVTLTKNLTAVTNNIQGPRKYPHHQI